MYGWLPPLPTWWHLIHSYLLFWIEPCRGVQCIMSWVLAEESLSHIGWDRGIMNDFWWSAVVSWMLVPYMFSHESSAILFAWGSWARVCLFIDSRMTSHLIDSFILPGFFDIKIVAIIFEIFISMVLNIIPSLFCPWLHFWHLLLGPLTENVCWWK